jgi:preprotein translocase subunit SecE
MRRLQNYIRDVLLELRKVTWPTRDELRGATITVIIFAIVCSVFVGVVDSALGVFVSSIAKALR